MLVSWNGPFCSSQIPFIKNQIQGWQRADSGALCLLVVTMASASAAAATTTDDPGLTLKRQYDAAKTALAANDIPQADLAYRQTVALGLRQLGNLALSEGQYEQATNYLDGAVKQTPDDLGLQVEDAIGWFRRNDVARAKAQINAVLAKEPGNARAHNVLGRIYLFEGHPAESIKELNTAVAQQADFETVYFLGIAYLKAKKVSDAAELFAKLQATAGDSAALHVLFGRAYIVTHFPEPAVAEFRKAVELDPKYPRAHSLLGYAYLDHLNEQGYPLARSMFQQELKIQPDDYLTLVLLGLTDVSLRDYLAAESVLLHAARVRPDGAAPYLYLGEAYTSTQRTKEAVAALQKYVSLVHNPEEFHRDLGRGYFLLGQGLLRLGRPEEAKKALARSQQLREAEFKYDQEHMFFDQEHQIEAKETADQGESHSSERIAGLLESGTAGEQSTQSMAQGGVSTDLEPPPVAVQKPQESAGVRKYRAFAAEVLASSYNDLGVMRAKDSKFAEAAEFFKQACRLESQPGGSGSQLGIRQLQGGAICRSCPAPGTFPCRASRGRLRAAVARLELFHRGKISRRLSKFSSRYRKILRRILAYCLPGALPSFAPVSPKPREISFAACFCRTPTIPQSIFCSARLTPSRKIIPTLSTS